MTTLLRVTVFHAKHYISIIHSLFALTINSRASRERAINVHINVPTPRSYIYIRDMDVSIYFFSYAHSTHFSCAHQYRRKKNKYNPSPTEISALTFRKRMRNSSRRVVLNISLCNARTKGTNTRENESRQIESRQTHHHALVRHR